MERRTGTLKPAGSPVSQGVTSISKTSRPRIRFLRLPSSRVVQGRSFRSLTLATNFRPAFDVSEKRPPTFQTFFSSRSRAHADIRAPDYTGQGSTIRPLTVANDNRSGGDSPTRRRIIPTAISKLRFVFKRPNERYHISLPRSGLQRSVGRRAYFLNPSLEIR